MTQRVGPRDFNRGPTKGTHTGDPHRGDPHRGPTQGTQTGDPHRGEGPTDDPPPEGRVTQGTHTGHTQTVRASGPAQQNVHTHTYDVYQ